MGKTKRKTRQTTGSLERHTKKGKTEESSPPTLARDLQETKAALALLIGKYKKAVDPLVRFTFDTMNTTAAERQNIYKAAAVFIQRGPTTTVGALPVGLGDPGLPTWDAGNHPTQLRFSGAQQVANWIADAQARGYAAGVGVVRFTVELTSDNGRHWSAPFEILH